MISGLRRLYRFGHRNFSSGFPLTNLLVAGNGFRPDLHILAPVQANRLAAPAKWDCQWADKDGTPGFHIAREPDETGHGVYLVQFSGLCDFRLDFVRGCISITHLPGASTHALEHLLIDQVMPCALAGLGDMVLHCACIESGSGSVLLLGQSGWGKSTLAGLLQRRGYRLYSDDCAVLFVDNGETCALSTYPSLRLYEDSIREAFTQVPLLRPVAEYTGKRRISLEGQDSSGARPREVRAIYVLNDPVIPQDKPTIESMTTACACMALIQHTFRLDLRDREQHALLLGKSARIAESIPSFTLCYPREFSRSAEAVDALEQHFSTLPPAGVSLAGLCETPAAEAR